MTMYNVHIYRELRLYFPGIEAATPEEAARKAADKRTEDAKYTDDCDGENLAALVDVAGDDEFEHSITIDFEAERLRKAAPALLEALQGCVFALDNNLDRSGPTKGQALAQARAALAQAKGQAA